MATLFKTRKKYYYEFPFYFFIFFPYIKILPMESDTQPYACLFSIFLLFIQLPVISKFKNISKYFLMALGVAIVLLTCNFNASSVRDVFGYVSILVIYAETLYMISRYGFNEKLFHVFSLIWLFVGLIQLYIPSFMTFFIAASRTTEGRGVCSLAVEPSYYGIVLQFFIIINILTHGDKRYNIFYGAGIVLLSRSAMSIAYLFVFILLYLLKYRAILVISIILVVAYILVTVSGAFSTLETNTNIRALVLLVKLLKSGPLLLVKLDASINDRIGSIVLSLRGFIDNAMLPRSFGAWNTYLSQVLPSQTMFYNISKGKILCTIGSILFYEGFLGLFCVYKLISNVKYMSDKFQRLILSIFLVLFYLTAIPLAFPMIGFVCALMKKTDKHMERKNFQF